MENTYELPHKRMATSGAFVRGLINIKSPLIVHYNVFVVGRLSILAFIENNNSRTLQHNEWSDQPVAYAVNNHCSIVLLI